MLSESIMFAHVRSNAFTLHDEIPPLRTSSFSRRLPYSRQARACNQIRREGEGINRPHDPAGRVSLKNRSVRMKQAAQKLNVTSPNIRQGSHQAEEGICLTAHSLHPHRLKRQDCTPVRCWPHATLQGHVRRGHAPRTFSANA